MASDFLRRALFSPGSLAAVAFLGLGTAAFSFSVSSSSRGSAGVVAGSGRRAWRDARGSPGAGTRPARSTEFAPAMLRVLGFHKHHNVRSSAKPLMCMGLGKANPPKWGCQCAGGRAVRGGCSLLKRYMAVSQNMPTTWAASFRH